MLSILDESRSDGIPSGSKVALCVETVGHSYIWDDDRPHILDKLLVVERLPGFIILVERLVDDG